MGPNVSAPAPTQYRIVFAPGFSGVWALCLPRSSGNAAEAIASAQGASGAEAVEALVVAMSRRMAAMPGPDRDAWHAEVARVQAAIGEHGEKAKGVA